MAHKQIIKLLRNGSLNTELRNGYLQQFRDIIEEHVYLGRVPQNATARYTCVVTPVATERTYNLHAESDAVTRKLQIDIYGNAFDANTKVEQCAEWLRLALSSYSGVIDDIETQHCQITRESLTTSQSVGSEGWEFRYSVDWEISYWQTITAVTE